MARSPLMGWDAIEGSSGDNITHSTGANRRAVGYVRVSRACQVKDGESLEAQEAEIRACCQLRGWNLLKVYRDEGASAWSLGARRRGYELLMAEREGWDTVICYKLDRLWRRSDMAIGAHKILKSEGKTVVSLTENLDTSTRAGEAMFAMMCVVAELFSSQSRERVLAIQRHIFETDPNAVLGLPPTGYKNTREGGKPRYGIASHNAEVVRQIFAYAGQGLTVRQIVARLRAQGVTYLRWNRPPPKRVNVSTVFNILHNPFYCGYVYKEGILKRAAHSKLVSDDDFNRVQIALLIRSRQKRSLPLLVGADRIEVRKTVDPRRAHRGEIVGGPTKYIPLRPAERIEAYFLEYGEASGKSLERMLREQRKGHD